MSNQPTYEIVIGEDVFAIKMDDLTVDDWCQVEEHSQMDAGEIFSRFLTGGMRARRAMLWLARKKSGKPVDWDSEEMNVRIGDMQVRDVTKPGKSSESEEDAKPDPPKKTGGSRSPTRSKSTSRTS